MLIPAINFTNQSIIVTFPNLTELKCLKVTEKHLLAIAMHLTSVDEISFEIEKIFSRLSVDSSSFEK